LLWCVDSRSWINSICTTWDSEFRLIDQNWLNSESTSKRKKRRKKNVRLFVVNFANHTNRFLFHDVNWSFKIVN
jgi:hypothetical protein